MEYDSVNSSCIRPSSGCCNCSQAESSPSSGSCCSSGHSGCTVAGYTAAGCMGVAGCNHLGSCFAPAVGCSSGCSLVNCTGLMVVVAMIVMNLSSCEMVHYL